MKKVFIYFLFSYKISYTVCGNDGRSCFANSGNIVQAAVEDKDELTIESLFALAYGEAASQIVKENPEFLRIDEIKFIERSYEPFLRKRRAIFKKKKKEVKI